MPSTLTKYALAKQLSKSHDLTHKAAVDLIETVADLIACHFQNGGTAVSLRGFGAFKIRKRRAFVGADPRSGEALSIPERKSLTFKPSAEIIRRIN